MEFGGGGRSRVSGGTSKDTIIKAIQEALNDIEISGGSATVTYREGNNGSKYINDISIPTFQVNVLES